MKTLISKKIHMRWYWTLLCLVGCSGIILCMSVALQIGSVVTTLLNLLRQPLLLLLNLLPIAAVLTLLYALIGNAFYAASFTSLLFNLLSLVNLIKIESRNDPLVPADIGLLKEAMQATGDYQLDLHVPYILVIVAVAVVLFLLGVKLKSARPRPLLRAVTGVAAVGCFALALWTLYPSRTIYNRFLAHTSNVYEYNIPSVFDGLGFNYCFLHNLNLYSVDKPEGYSADEAAAWAADVGAAHDGTRPNVVFIQCEAFSDIMADPAFTYSAEENPLYLYQLVADSDRALSGHIVVSNYGAGTANTEFDILTGMQTNMISETQTSAFRVIHRNTNSLARTFAADGYSTYFMHPGMRWFYNRESVYDHLGISDSVFSGAFADEEFKGNMISDEAFKNHLIADFEARTAGTDQPLFAFTVTIQNHQAYPYSKYEGLDIAPAQVRAPVSDAAMETLSVYAEGIRDSSKMLYDLTEYFDTSNEPTILVFWGDHLPALGNNFSVYQELGLSIGDQSTLAGAVSTYTTPFVVWANRAYCEENDFAAAKAALELPENPLISDIYLGGIVYELTGMTGADPYFDALNQARRTLPVIGRGFYVLPDGSYTDSLTTEQQALVDRLHKWEYYRLMDEKIK